MAIDTEWAATEGKRKEAQEAIYARLGLPKNPANRFKKMTDALFGETAPVFPVQQDGATGNGKPKVAVGENVQLFAFGEEAEGVGAERFSLRIEAKTREGEVLGYLAADEEQSFVIALNVGECIAFVHALEPLEVRVDLLPRETGLTQARMRDITQILFYSRSWYKSSTRYKSWKTYFNKRPERMAAFGLDQLDDGKKQRAGTSEKDERPIDEATIEGELRAIRDFYEGRVRAGTVKQLERECPDYKSAKADIARYAKDRGMKVVDFLRQEEVVSGVVTEDSIPRPPQREVDAWYEKVALSPSTDREPEDPELSVLAFTCEVDSKYDLEPGSAGARVYELFRAGDLLECRGVVDERWHDLNRISFRGTSNDDLRFDFLGEENAIVVSASKFDLSSVKRAGYFDYSGDDLVLLVSDPDPCGVAPRGVRARVLGTRGGRERLIVAIEVSVALDEARYRGLRTSINPHWGGVSSVKPVSITMETPGRGSATFESMRGSSSDEYVLADEAAAGDFAKAYARAFEAYKRVVKTTVVDGGVAVPVVYKPSRAFTQLEKYLKAGKRVAPSEKLQVDDWADWQKDSIIVDADSPRYGVSRSLLASRGGSARCLVDMMRVLALLTDEEMIERVVKGAPRKKDGGLVAGRIAARVDMDGIFDDGTYYSACAKSDSLGAIEIQVKRNQQHWQSKFYGGAAKFLDENADIVRRMGL